VCDPTIRQPGFDLPRQQWSLLNRFRTEQGHCGACRRKWRLTDTDLCPYGETQTMSYIVESCPLTKLNGGLSRLHSADEDETKTKCLSSAKSRMDANMQLTINSFRRLFSDKIFSSTLPWLLVKSVTSHRQLSKSLKSLTFPNFPDKLSPCQMSSQQYDSMSLQISIYER